MKTKFLGAAAVSAAALFAYAPGAAAQTAAPTYALGGAVAGACLLNGSQLGSASAVGKAVDARIKQLDTQVSTELTPEKNAIENEAKAINTAAQTATTAAQQQPLQQREQALQQRINTYQQKVQVRQAEMQATARKALARISTEALPVIRQVAAQRSCGVVLDASAVIDANPSMDITPAVVAGLDAKIKTFAFERERLDTQAARPAQ